VENWKGAEVHKESKELLKPSIVYTTIEPFEVCIADLTLGKSES
jgi:hypothetical protein